MNTEETKGTTADNTSRTIMDLGTGRGRQGGVEQKPDTAAEAGTWRGVPR